MDQGLVVTTDLVTTNRNRVFLIDAIEGQVLREVVCTGNVCAVCFSPDSRRLVAGGDDR